MTYNTRCMSVTTHIASGRSTHSSIFNRTRSSVTNHRSLTFRAGSVEASKLYGGFSVSEELEALSDPPPKVSQRWFDFLGLVHRSWTSCNTSPWPHLPSMIYNVYSISVATVTLGSKYTLIQLQSTRSGVTNLRWLTFGGGSLRASNSSERLDLLYNFEAPSNRFAPLRSPPVESLRSSPMFLPLRSSNIFGQLISDQASKVSER